MQVISRNAEIKKAFKRVFNEQFWGFTKNLIFSFLFFIIFIFFMGNIQATVKEGLEKEESTKLLEEEIQKLKNENENLQHEYEVYSSEHFLESQIRNIRNVKKEGEQIYLISIDKDKEPTPTPTPEEEQDDVEKESYVKWLELILF